MKITIPQTQIAINFTVTPLDSPIKDILAFAELEVIHGQSEAILFKVRGYSIKLMEFSNKPTLMVNAPAFRSGRRFKKSFVIDDKELWNTVREAMLDELSQKNGGLTATDYWNKYNEKGGDISDQIPF